MHFLYKSPSQRKRLGFEIGRYFWGELLLCTDWVAKYQPVATVVLLQPLMGTGLIFGLWVLAYEKLFDLDTLSTVKSSSTAVTELRGSVLAGP